MKPFNLVKALSGKEIETKYGAKVTNFTYIENVLSTYCYLGVHVGVIYIFNKFGACLESPKFNLFMSSKKIIFEGWVNLYKTWIDGYYKTEKEAKENSSNGCLGQKFVSFEMEDKS